MRALGIETRADLARQTLSFPQDRFGKSGSWYYDIARGQDDRPVQPDRERKSSGSETTFSEDLSDPVQIEAGVIAMANDVWAWCEKANARGRTATVKIKWADFQLSTRSRSLESAIESRLGLHQVAIDLIRSVFPPPKGVRRVGVTSQTFDRNPVARRLNSLFVKCNRRLPTRAPSAGANRAQKKRQQDCSDRRVDGQTEKKIEAGRNHSPIFVPRCRRIRRRQVHSLPLYAHVLGAAAFEDPALPLCANSGQFWPASRTGQVDTRR
jgi:DNA polymerase-4